MAAREYRGLAYRNNADLAAWLAKRPTETALEPELPIIDPHHHLWHTPTRGLYFLPELMADLSGGKGGGGHNIVSTVFLECQSMFRAGGPDELKPVGEVEFVAGQAAQSASGQYGKTRVCEGIIGWADLMLGTKVREVLEAEIAAGGGRFRGVRYGTSYDEGIAGKFVSRTMPAHRLLDPKLREGFAVLGKMGLTFDSWHFHPQLPDLVDLARAFPDTTIICDHVGGMLGIGQYAGKTAEVMPVWKKSIAELAKCPNVHMKLGGLGMTSFGFGFEFEDAPPSSEKLAETWRPYIEPCIEAFGVDRCMFESNFPPDKQSCGYTELWNAFKHLTRNASAAEKTALYSGTAAKVYRLIKP
ncbi:amidohydrolase family protein [Reyranella sp.]|uniref:amidohydrolase family protein n=1 Tax=Reyranella sp. TaxID=1929291 RepID=UPI003D0E4B56